MSSTLSRHANPNKNRTPRHRAREFALQGLYQWLMSQEDAGVIDAYIRNAHGFEKADREHFDALLHGTIRDVATLREEIVPYIDRAMDQLSPIEHAALLSRTLCLDDFCQTLFLPSLQPLSWST
jgi:N utilization substance protein B